MPPKGSRKQPARQTQQVSAVAPEVIAKRTKRHLEELERSNYVEAKQSLGILDPEDEEGKGSKHSDRSRAALSDKKRKSTAGVRRILLYRKNLATLIEESGIASLPKGTPSYLTAVAPPSKYPTRDLCSVCGYWGNYHCQKCGMFYCAMTCQATHAETRCERRVL